MQCCNKHVIIYSGARVSEFIRAIRSFISIDFQIYFSDSGRFLCVNAYFGASIHLILFFVSNHGKQERW